METTPVKFQEINHDGKIFSMQQHAYEIKSLCNFLKEKNCKNFIELGSYDGGTFYTLSTVCPGRKISIDHANCSFGVGEARRVKRNSDLESIFENTSFIEGNSHSDAVKQSLEAILKGDKVDFLFIDGDHTYEGVKRDYELYRNYVKPDGYIAFHDISDTPLHRNHNCQVDMLWNELMGEKYEFITKNGAWGGIGIIKNSGLPPINLAIWQIHFNQVSYNSLEKNFIPYENTGRVTLFFENEVLIDVWSKFKEIWSKSEYVGVLSWRFREKTNLTHAHISNHIQLSEERKDVYSMIPTQYYNTFPSPYSVHGFANIQAICKIMDSVNLFPFKTAGHDSTKGRFKNFCNYFICKPEIFDDYVKNYLVALAKWLITYDDPELHRQLRIMVNHRGQLYPIHTFLMEGLFECYVIYKGYSHGRITNDIPIEHTVVNNIIKKEALNR